MEHVEGAVHRTLVVRQGDEIVGGSLEQDTVLRGPLCRCARQLFSRKVQETHFRNSGDPRDDARMRALDFVEAVEQSRPDAMEMVADAVAREHGERRPRRRKGHRFSRQSMRMAPARSVSARNIWSHSRLGSETMTGSTTTAARRGARARIISRLPATSLNGSSPNSPRTAAGTPSVAP